MTKPHHVIRYFIFAFTTVLLCSFHEANARETFHNLDSLKYLVSSTEGVEKVNSLISVSFEYRLRGFPDLALIPAKEAKFIAEGRGDTLLIAITLLELSSVYALLGEVENSLIVANLAKIYSEMYRDSSLMYSSYLNLAGVMSAADNSQMAMFYYQKSQQCMLKDIPDIQRAEIYNTIGSIFSNAGEDAQAFTWYKKAEKIYSQNPYEEVYSTLLNKILITEYYLAKMNLDSAMYYTQIAIDFGITTGNDSMDFGQHGLMVNVLAEQGKYKEALTYLETHEKQLKGNGDADIELLYHVYKAQVYHGLNDERFLDAFETALQKANNLNRYHQMTWLLKKLMTWHEKRNDMDLYKLSVERAFELDAVIDSIREMSKSRGFELSERMLIQEKDIFQLLADNNLKDSKLKTRGYIIAWVSFGAFLILLVTLVVYSQKLAQEKSNRALIQRNLELVNAETCGIERRSKELEIIKKELEEELNDEAKIAARKKRYENSSMGEEMRKDLKKRIVYAVEGKEMYKLKNFNLSVLCGELDINRYYITQTINQEFAVNFNEYVNNLRIKAARRLLTLDEYDSYKLEFIGSEVGFTSKGAFYLAFKKFTGITPAYFRKHAKEAFEKS